MSDAVARTLDDLLPERLQRLRRVSGLPVVFGGGTTTVGAEQHLVISRLAGTVGRSLRGLSVPSGRGLGGAVLRHGTSACVNDYGTAKTITHEYDRIVVGEERIVSIVAVPVVVHGSVHGVLYGAVRDRQPIGERARRGAHAVAEQLQRDVERRLAAPAAPGSGAAHDDALAELADIIAATGDPELRARLRRVYRGLHPPAPAVAARLTDRELDVLRLVATGATNLEAGAELGLSPETVKAYLRTAMRKLQARTRSAAVHAARTTGLL